MDTFLQDLKFAARTLVKDRGFAVTAGLTLALCIGANAAIFGIVASVLLKPLPFPQPERLVTMWNAYPGAGFSMRGNNSAPDYTDRRALAEVFDEVAAYQTSGMEIELGGVPERLRGMRVTPGFFRLLRADAAVGRTLTEEEGEYGRHTVAVLGNELWQDAYGGDPAVVGKEILIAGRAHEIVGVMPPGFRFLDGDVRLWTSLAFTDEQLRSYHSNNWSMVARLRPGITLEQAQTRIDALNARNMDAAPELKPLLVNAGFHTPLYLLQDDLVRDVRGTIYLLWGGVAFVLLIGCLNVANLVLVRSTARARELATRFALGAGRGRIARQLLTETTLLTLAAAAAGLLLGQATLSLAGDFLTDNLPRAQEIALDPAAVGYTLLLALGVGAVVTLIPLAGIARQDLSAVFREEGRSGTASRGVRLARKGMVVAQVAFALVLLVGAGLLLASFRQLLGVDPGFDAEGVLTARVSLPSARYPELTDDRQFLRAATARIAALPGVERAAAINNVPLSGNSSDSIIFAEGHVMQEGESAVSPLQSVVTPGYFETMGIRVLQGRTFDERDGEDGEPVIIIDQALASRYWPDGDALGERMWQPNSAEDLTDPESASFFRIVGIVESVTHHGLTGGNSAGAYYFPADQMRFPWGNYHLVARAASSDASALIGALRGVVRDLDPQMPLYDVRTMQERISLSLSDRRAPLILTLTFGAVALFLAAVGIYGVLAHLVSLRTREVGIRMALGSDARSIFRLILREGAFIVAVGLVLGLAGSLLVGRAIQSQLYGVGALDPTVLASVAGLLSAVAFLACLVPARRATRIDPVDALTDA